MQASTVAPMPRGPALSPRSGGAGTVPAMTDRTHNRLAPRRTGARVGAVDEYTALQRAAMDRLVQHGIDAASATIRLRAEAHRLAVERGLDHREVSVAVVPFVEATEQAIAELHDELRLLTQHVLRLARSRLGLC